MTSAPDAHPGDAISALLDGELDAPAAAAVTAHLDVCEPCARERDAVAGVRAALRGLPLSSVPDGVLSPHPGVHLGDALSGLLDGELDEEERRRALVHLEACPACGAELAEVASARDAVRGLPVVEAPGMALVARFPRRERRTRAGVVGLAAAVAGLTGLAVTAEPVAAGAPELSVLLAEHELAPPSAVRFERLSLGDPTPTPSASPQAGIPQTLPPSYRLVAVERHDGRVHARYAGLAGRTLSLFSKLPTDRIDGVPDAGAEVAVGGAKGRHWVTGGDVVLTWSAGESAYALVTDGGAEEAVMAAGAVPRSPDGGIGARARKRCRGAVDLIG